MDIWPVIHAERRALAGDVRDLIVAMTGRSADLSGDGVAELRSRP
jgi:hypothetical protein